MSGRRKFLFFRLLPGLCLRIMDWQPPDWLKIALCVPIALAWLYCLLVVIPGLAAP